MGEKRKNRSPWVHDPGKIAAAETVLRQTKRLPGDPEKLLRAIAERKPARLPIRSEPNVIACLFASLDRQEDPFPIPPDAEVLRRLVRFCLSETDLLSAQGAPRYADALLALSAYHRDWVRPLDTWRARSHNAHRQFGSLLRHLIARYEVPSFLDAAWLAGLTPEAVQHQEWFKHVAGGRNIRTAGNLPVALTKKQAHHFFRAPADLDIPSAFRWALVLDLGGDDRLARSVLGTRIGTSFEHEAFWASVVRFFITHPALSPRHHGPILDFLHEQKFVASVPNPLADRSGQPPLVPPQPHLRMWGRTPESLLRAVSGWHRDLAEMRSAATAAATWGPSGFAPFVHEEEGEDDGRRVYEVAELLTARELLEEGRVMRHCVASYANACASGRSSIWSLRKRIESGRVFRLATVEVRRKDGTIVQVRKRSNRPATRGELSVLGWWGDARGPKLASWYSV